MFHTRDRGGRNEAGHGLHGEPRVWAAEGFPAGETGRRDSLQGTEWGSKMIDLSGTLQTLINSGCHPPGSGLDKQGINSSPWGGPGLKQA